MLVCLLFYFTRCQRSRTRWKASFLRPSLHPVGCTFILYPVLFLCGSLVWYVLCHLKRHLFSRPWIWRGGSRQWDKSKCCLKQQFANATNIDSLSNDGSIRSANVRLLSVLILFFFYLPAHFHFHKISWMTLKRRKSFFFLQIPENQDKEDGELLESTTSLTSGASQITSCCNICYFDIFLKRYQHVWWSINWFVNCFLLIIDLFFVFIFRSWAWSGEQKQKSKAFWN